MNYSPHRAMPSLPAFMRGAIPCLSASNRPEPLKCRQRAHTRWYCSAQLPPVVFVLGGPGSGKGTQCGRLSKEFDVVQICAGDLLRREAASGSKLGMKVAETIRTGAIVPGHVTVGLLRDAIKENAHVGTVLIDGFPRAMDQALLFEQGVSECKFVLFFKCDTKEMVSRLLKRGATSGRIDDNATVIEKRLKTYMTKTIPVLDYYREKGLLREIDSTVGDAAEVYKTTRTFFEQPVTEVRNL